MRSTSLVSAPVLMFLTIGCGPFGVIGSGTAKTESREFGGFTAIHFSGVGKLVVEQTGKESLSVTADDNIVPLLDSSVSDGTLHLGVKSGDTISPKTPIEFKVGVKDLSKVIVSGAGNTDIKQLKTDKLDVSISGVGNVTAAGSADNLKLVISGTGNFNGEKFAVKRASVACDGVGNAVVDVSDSLDAKISGVGSIEYLGKPEVKQSVTGVGSVKKRQGN